MHEFRTIEDAILTRLEPLKDIGLRTLDTYAGQFDVEELDELTYQFPCIYIIVGGFIVKEENRIQKCNMDIVLLAGDKNIKGSRAAKRGDSVSPGVYQLLLAIRNSLNRQKSIAKWTPYKLKYERPIVYEPKYNICLYGAGYEIQGII